MNGRRLPDALMSEWPEHIQPGDYWKILSSNGLPKPPEKPSPSNLTGTCWFVVAPKGDGGGYALGRLELHTVREHDDGTISVRRGDGSSNSIDIRGANGYRFHGYIEHGVWETLPDSVLP